MAGFSNWMLCKMKFTKQLDNGAFKRVTEAHLLAAQSFTDAETRCYQEIGEYVRGEFQVTAIARQEIKDIFGLPENLPNTAWFKCIAAVERIDDEGGKASVHKETYLAQATSAKHASQIMEDIIASYMDSHNTRLVSVVETPIVEVYPFRNDQSEEVPQQEGE